MAVYLIPFKTNIRMVVVVEAVVDVVVQLVKQSVQSIVLIDN